MTDSTEVAKHTERAIKTHMLGQYMEAERLYRKALAGLGDETNPTYQDLLTLNVRLLFGMGEYDNALKVGHGLVKLREKHFGFHHPQTASALRLVAEIKAAQGNMTSATLDIRRGLDVWMDTLGWVAPEPDPNDFELHQMGGPRNLLPEFEWIFGALDQTAAVARLTASQQDARRFTLLLEIGNAFAWLGIHRTASQLFKAASTLVNRVPPQMVWQSYWAANQAAQSFIATDDAAAGKTFLTSLLSVLNASFENGTDVTPLILVTLASIDEALGDLEQSRVNLTKSLNLLTEIHGDTHIQVSKIHVKLGELFHKLGDIRSSEAHFDKAISIIESWHGTSDISLVQPLYKKGLMHKSARHYPQAEKAFARSLEVLLPRDQGDVDLGAKIFEELSLVYMKQYSFQQAQMAQMRGLDMLREHGRPTDLLLAQCEINMALIYLSIAKYVDAEKNAASALAVFEKQPDKQKYRREIALLYIIHAKIEIELGRLQPASQSLRQAEAMIETMPEPDIELTKELHLCHAGLYLSQGSPAKAITRLNEVIELDEKSTSKLLSELTLTAMLELVNMQLMSGQTARIEDSLLRIVKLTEEKSGPTSADLLRALTALASFYVRQKKLTAAEAAIDRSTNIVEHNQYLRKQPVYGGFLMTYADLLIAKSAYDIATEKLKRALAVYEGCFSSLHPKCADIWINISALLLARGVEDQADEAAHKAVTICSNAFEWNHNATMKAVAYEAFISIKRERFDVALTLAERLFPAITSIRIPADFRAAQALSEVLKNELVNNRTRNVTAIQEYLERNLKQLLYVYGDDALDVLTDLMTFIYKRDSRQMAVTIGDTIVDYLARPDCLIDNRKGKMQTLLMKCHDYAYTAESKALIDKIKMHLAQ
jgi:hypothetical protein